MADKMAIKETNVPAVNEADRTLIRSLTSLSPEKNLLFKGIDDYMLKIRKSKGKGEGRRAVNMEKVVPLAEKIYEEAKASGLTLEEFRALAGILGTWAHEFQKEREKKVLAEKL
ncbi:hypothetical protein [Turicimonas muris]|uniref:hypothetical protein n=1 Tax=Turicimonas muris TaxID=1796652 RepID=UPI00260EB0B0|nr:hypothetical protein [Turicimonas muris]